MFMNYATTANIGLKVIAILATIWISFHGWISINFNFKILNDNVSFGIIISSG